MKGPVDSIALDGENIRITLKPPVPRDGRALAAAACVRVLERYPAVQRAIAVWGQAEFEVTRTQLERMLRPDGIAAIADRAKWQSVINQLVLQ
jgi:hypothetical protein